MHSAPVPCRAHHAQEVQRRLQDGLVEGAVVCEIRYRLHRVRWAALHRLLPRWRVPETPGAPSLPCPGLCSWSSSAPAAHRPSPRSRPRRLLTPPCCPAYSLNAPPAGAAQLAPGAVLGAYVGRCLTSEAAERESSRSAYVSEPGAEAGRAGGLGPGLGWS